MAEQLSERSVLVDGRRVVLILDEQHLLAHKDDFLVPFDQIIALVAQAIGQTSGPKVRSTLRHAREIGMSRCISIKGVQGAYWGLRPGRTYPSHLIRGRPEATNSLCVWGSWDAPDRFRLLTVYAGEAAPREIHDPEIPLTEIDGAIAFWTAHALVVD